MMQNVTVYDNGGMTFDRYTVVHKTGEAKDFYGMSEDPSAFNQYLGSSPEYEEGEHLGVVLKAIPKNLKSAILDRIE